MIANPSKSPKAIFVSGYASAPLSADLDFTLQGKEKELQAAVSALGKLTEGKVHISVGKNANSPLVNLTGVTIHKVSGPHPSGNVGTLINKVDPINKGEIVWTVNAQDLVIIGELLLTGKFNAERVVALVVLSIPFAITVAVPSLFSFSSACSRASLIRPIISTSFVSPIFLYLRQC